MPDAPRAQLARVDVAPGPEISVVPLRAEPIDTACTAFRGDGMNEVTAALRQIRHRIEALRTPGPGLVLGVTSARDGEGKSRVAVQLSLVLCEARRARVLLVEASFARPSLSERLGFDLPRGQSFSTQIASALRGPKRPWIVSALGPALHVLAESRHDPRSPRTLHSAYFPRAIEEVAPFYDFVVIDAPSVLGSGDAHVVERVSNRMILAARRGGSRGRDVRRAAAEIAPEKSLGVVLWGSATTPPG